jgi:hypothetical protein
MIIYSGISERVLNALLAPPPLTNTSGYRAMGCFGVDGG